MCDMHTGALMSLGKPLYHANISKLHQGQASQVKAAGSRICQRFVQQQSPPIIDKA
jgi:hypothetical protein